jgi:hypothetical protein
MRIASAMADALGSASSFILVLTIAAQVHEQWRDDQSAGVSVWLFVAQVAASIGSPCTGSCRQPGVRRHERAHARERVGGLWIKLRHRRRARAPAPA